MEIRRSRPCTLRSILWLVFPHLGFVGDVHRWRRNGEFLRGGLGVGVCIEIFMGNLCTGCGSVNVSVVDMGEVFFGGAERILLSLSGLRAACERINVFLGLECLLCQSMVGV